jgi:hypothetical protein
MVLPRLKVHVQWRDDQEDLDQTPSGRLRHPNGRCSDPTGKPDREHLDQTPPGRLRHPNGWCSDPTGKPDREHLDQTPPGRVITIPVVLCALTIVLLLGLLPSLGVARLVDDDRSTRARSATTLVAPTTTLPKLVPANPPPPASGLFLSLQTNPTSAKIDVSPELDYLRDAQLPSGAFRIRPNSNDVIPYWGNYATIGLGALARRVPEAADMGWKALAWYASHQSPTTGYVQDHVVRGSQEVATGTYDSTDSYAGTFLVAVESMYNGTACLACVEKLLPALTLSIKAIESTQDPADGLTWAKPEGRVKYLLDQTEVAAGLRSAKRLAILVGDNVLASRIAGVQQRHDVGLRTMMGDGETVLWAIAANSTVASVFELPSERAVVNDGILYPDSLAKVSLSALVPDFVPIDRGAAQRYVGRWPRWTQDPDIWGFPVLVSWALQNSGDQTGAQNGVAAFHALLVDGYRGSALTVGHIGQLLVLEA